MTNPTELLPCPSACGLPLSPIETAPKDGTWIIGWAEKDSSPYRISWGTNHRSAMCWCTQFGSFDPSYITHWIAPAPVASEEVERVARAMWDAEHLQSWDGDAQRPGTRITDFDRDVYRRHARAAIAALSLTTPARAVSDWRPIADAPKDEVSKLGTDGVFTAVISWIPDNYFGNGNPARWHPITPTHWMPLPAAPSLALIGGGE